MKIIRSVIRNVYGPSVDLMDDTIVEMIAGKILSNYFEGNTVKSEVSAIVKPLPKLEEKFDGVIKNAVKRYQSNGSYRVAGQLYGSSSGVKDGTYVNTNIILKEENKDKDIIAKTKDSVFKIENGYVSVETVVNENFTYVFDKKVFKATASDFMPTKSAKYTKYVTETDDEVVVSFPKGEKFFTNETRAILNALKINKK